MKLCPFVQHIEIINRCHELPKIYVHNGAVYVAETGNVIESQSFLTEETAGYVMPTENSVDIDNTNDLKLAELILNDRAMH